MYTNLTTVTRTRDSPQHDFVHHIRTTCPASFQRYRRLDPTKKRIAQTEFEDMMELGIVRPSDSMVDIASPYGQEIKPRRLAAL